MLSAEHDGVRLFEYVHSGQRPYFHPVRSLDGVVVTDCAPADHTWHTGISLALPYVGETNFWGGPTFVRDQGYVQLPNNGTVRHDEFERLADNGFDERLSWITPLGETVLTERREVRWTVFAEQRAWALDFATALTNARGRELVFGSPTTNGRPQAGYGGLLWRGPASFSPGTVIGPDMGERGERLVYIAQGTTLTFIDAPTSLTHPTRWFVRSEPFAAVCPAPFFAEEHTLAPDATLRLRYRVIVSGMGLQPTTGWETLHG